MDEQSSYRRLPLWQWIIIYLLLGGILYVLIYYFALYRQSSANNNPFAPNLSPSPTTTANITITPSGFSPQSITVNTGSTVSWTNSSGQLATVNSDPHPLHTDYSPLNLNQINDGAAVTLIFDTPGTYSFHNHLIPDQKGTIIVR